MSAATDIFENELLLFLFNNVPIAGLGDAAGLLGSAVAGSFYISLHTADPGEPGAQDTSEASYPGYARVAVARTAAGWTVIDNTYQNTAVVQFPSATGGSETIEYVGIGDASTGAGKLRWRASFAAPLSIVVTAGIAPKFDAGTITGTVN